MGSSDGRLGYKPQKELVYNKLLPYSDKLDEESQDLLAKIKLNFGKAVLMREISPGVLHWAAHLVKYIRLYGRKFSKEDHIQLINLVLDIMLIPNLELRTVHHMAHLLHLLLKKKELLGRDDLVIPWKPLYQLFESSLYSHYEHLGMLLLPGNYETVLKTLIRSCRVYFSVEATQEMMDEWGPLLCPFDVTMSKALAYFELFLPTTLPPEHHDKGFKLWFPELMELWKNCHNSPSLELHLVWLFSRLAHDTIGYIDWDPYIPLIFTRLLWSFNLPGGPNKVQVSRLNNTFDTIATVNWISAMLGGGSSCQMHITRLFKALDSYYHPSNNGRWMVKLQRLLYKLPAAVVKRLHRERYSQPTWETPVPKSHRLTDSDIIEFVASVKPAVLLSMFSKGGSADSAAALQNLSIIRPELVIPPVLERLYSSLETLTEPHRLTATMHCVVAVARALVRGGKYFPEGPSHVIPLLMGSLPGIDPNDIKKCMVTFQFISTFTTLIPLMDCSKAVQVRTDLTELEQDLCLATVELEDFVLQFMDRCFAVIEASSLEHPTRLDRETEKMNLEENILEVGLSSTFSSILTQSSPDIYKAALRKLHLFVSSHIFETKVAGKYAANMCRSAARVNPNLALRTFLPHFSKLIVTLTASEDVAKEEMLDSELLFCLLLLSEVVRCDGKYLLEYRTQIEQVLQRTLHLTSRQGYLLSGSLLRHVLKSLTQICPLDFRSSPLPWEKCELQDDYLAIKDWGTPGNIHNLGIQWHVPSEDELAWAQQLLDTFLIAELDVLEKWRNKAISLSREEVQQSLNIILDCLLGAGGALPQWPRDSLSLIKSSVPLYCVRVTETGTKAINFQDGRNIRQVVGKTIQQVLAHIMESCEDDTKSLFHIIRIYHSLMFYYGAGKEDFETRWKGFHVVKKALENKLVGSKQHIRALLVDRTLLQHEMRLLECSKIGFTPMHRDLMMDLLRLSMSHYSEVRSKAQNIWLVCVRSFSQCYRPYIPDIICMLKKDESITHEQFKGALYVILGYKQRSYLTYNDWSCLHDVWPAIVQAQHSEKPSIIRLMDQISENLQKYLETMQLKLEVPEQCIEDAKKLWSGPEPRPREPLPSDEEIVLGAVELEERNETNMRNYNSLVDTLVDLINNGNLHWRHYNLALVMLSLLIRYDITLPGKAVQVFVQHLVHDTLNIRKIAIASLAAIMKQLKRSHPKKAIIDADISIESMPVHPIMKRLLEETSFNGHSHPSNLWLQYNSLNIPQTREAWDKALFMHKTHIGFRAWSTPLQRYEPDDMQPILDRRKEELGEAELPVHEAFTNQEFVDKLISFMSLEESKGRDKFDAKRFTLFKGLFRNFGDTFLPYFCRHLEKQVVDPQESAQRCAAEIVAGLLRGSKHWNFEKMQDLQKFVEPLLKSALNNIIPETMVDWGTCIATASESRDPNKYYWLFELLMNNPLKGENGSFLESSRLYALLGAVAQQEWRVLELLHRLKEYLQPHLTHTFQNVRDRIGTLLSAIFMFDTPLKSADDCLKLAPNRAAFIDQILPQLAVLNVENGLNHADGEQNPSASPSMERSGIASTPDRDSSKALVGTGQNHVHGLEVSEERKKAVNLFKTACKWLITSVSRTPYAAPPEIFQLLPTLCLLQNDTTDDELQRDCTVTLAIMGHAHLLPVSINTAILTVKQITTSSSWHARASALSFLQFMVFSNLFSVLHRQEWVDEITSLVLQLLKDERLEVREAAADSLGGLLHCEFVKVTDDLLNSFKSKCKKKLKRRKNQLDGIQGAAVYDPQEVMDRHSAVLGLCACVNAYPYDVPEFLPDILVLLADRLNDPQPISTTIKKTLSNFRRTHHDSWRDHKLKFTNDQLVVITDLLVSPSYYA